MLAFVVCLFCLPVSAVQSAPPASILDSFIDPAVEKKTIAALKLMSKGQHEKAYREIKSLSWPLASKLARWVHYRRDPKDVAFNDLARFLLVNKDWPGMSSALRQVEDRFPEHWTARHIAAWFDKNAPKSNEGHLAYLKALQETSQSQKMKDHLKKAWPRLFLSPEEHMVFIQNYARLVSIDGHKKRLNWLLRKKQYTNARMLARVMGRDYVTLTEARIALLEGKPNAKSLLAKVPVRMMADSDLVYNRLVWLRKSDNNKAAIEMLKHPPMAALSAAPDKWWRERHIIIRRMMEQGRFDQAYWLAAGNKQKTGLPFAQAEFLSGWLALRYMKEPSQAVLHFQKLFNGVKTPTSKSRGSYWLARAYEAQNHAAQSRKWYEEASQYQTAFYGQLAAGKLGRSGTLGKHTKPSPSAADRASFQAHEKVMAVRLLKKAGLAKDASMLLRSLIKGATPAEIVMTTSLAREIHHTHDVYYVARKAKGQGILMMDDIFPTMISAMKYDNGVDNALIHSVIRQESAFDIQAQSHAGARGLMQLMPGTASDTARKHDIRHDLGWLTTRPYHNVNLGTLYLRQMIERFDGSVPMAVAAYNAGPGRVDRWIDEFGDPRTKDIEMLDWMESIPVYETRNYVQRVLENYYIYRHKLGSMGFKHNISAAVH